MSSSHQYENKVSLYAWIVWGLGSVFFFIQYFPRVLPSIIEAQLRHDFHIDALAFGNLAAFYLYAYVGMQVPVGMLYDRYGVRRLLSLAALLAGLGCGLFAMTDSFAMACSARFLIGFGGSFAFVGALKLANLWFPSRYFGLLVGITQALGMLGAAMGQGPMAYALHYFDWWILLNIFAVVFLALSFLIMLIVRDRRDSVQVGLDHIAPKTLVGFWESLFIVLKNSQSWFNAGYLAFVYAPTMAFAGLWGVSYVERAYFITHEVAAMAVSCIFLGWALAGPFVGWFSDYIQKRKPILLISGVLSGIILSVVIYNTTLPIPALFVLCFLYGVANTGIGASYALSGEINPQSVTGTSVAFANMASIIVGSAFQPLIGWLLVLFWDQATVNGVPVYSVHDFQQALFILPVCSFLAVFFALFVKDSYGKPMYR